MDPNLANVEVDDRNAAGIISAITNQIRDEDRLLPDGSNFAVWGDFVEEKLRDAINDPDYLMYESTSALHERIARSILLSSVNCSLRRTLQRFPFASGMFTELRARFNVVSRAAQLNAFRRLLRFNISDHPTTATIASAIDDQLDELRRLNLTLTRNELAGLILQNSLGTEPDLMEEVDRRVELALSRSRTGTVEDFESIIRTIGIVRNNLRHQGEVRGREQRMATPAPLAMRTDAHTVPHFQQPQDHGAPPAEDLNSVEAAATRAETPAGHLFHLAPTTAIPPLKTFPSKAVFSLSTRSSRPWDRQAPIHKSKPLPDLSNKRRRKGASQGRATHTAHSTAYNESTKNDIDKNQSAGPLKQAREWRRPMSRGQVKGEDPGLRSWVI
ncbi:hypothetical protein PTTG_02300 [Puccinia triticina 1-1 BBBD Race 1]|uniref:Uncharacterized protein n=1 Tax=Puccinia triticina (isolate 1-1 / race 1 (BBBD)) TaxID=630390 RepID=A0A180GTE8_PUCT1|nr:hypothetical protein PTTG_02300 [Puccinia triticina 1-1 BBBD Race 1]